MDFSTFKLDDRLMQAVRAAGYVETTPIQEVAIPHCLDGRDIIGSAQTGTGKTAAFVLPILQRLLTTPGRRNHTRALIVAPTRELAEQINSAIKQLAKFTKIKSATVYGGVGFDPQERALRRGTEIIVACPGRLLDHVQRGNANLSQVEVLVLDEADRMLDMGFLPPVRKICEETPNRSQTMLFSATFAPELKRLAKEIMQDPERIELGLAAPAQTVEHALLPVAQEQKTALLLELLQSIDSKSVLVFTRTKHRADRIAAQVDRCGHQSAVLHSNKSQGQRQRALDSFRSGQCRLLIATDIAARGLDVQSISHVINYDIPDTADAYIHRIGRTGRAEHSGDAMTLVTTDDQQVVREIEKALGKPITVRKMEGFDYDRSFRATVSGNAPSAGGRSGGRGGAGLTSWSGGARTGGATRRSPRRR
jgi:ATP-dependent RNA helicase RhlE